MRKFNRSYQWIWPLLFGLLLTACDELMLEPSTKAKVFANRVENSVFFHPMKETVDSLGRDALIYIPVYSEVLISGGGKLNLAITLSLRNTDFSAPMLINQVSYYDSAGKLIENYLETPYILEPLASTQFFVTQADARGGLGANFIVSWSTPIAANTPITEAVMVGSTGTQGMSFISLGREINNNNWKKSHLLAVNADKQSAQ